MSKIPHNIGSTSPPESQISVRFALRWLFSQIIEMVFPCGTMNEWESYFKEEIRLEYLLPPIGSHVKKNEKKNHYTLSSQNFKIPNNIFVRALEKETRKSLK